MSSPAVCLPPEPKDPETPFFVLSRGRTGDPADALRPEEAARVLREQLEQDDPEFARLRKAARVELMRRQAAELRHRADALLQMADTLEQTAD
jgi:hypothetical protein